MQNRKKLNQEIESKKKQRKLLERGIFALVAVLLLAGIAWTVWSTPNMSWALRFNGERIDMSELRYYEFAFQSNLNDPEARDFIVDQLVSALVVLDHAERHGLVLSEEEVAETINFAENQEQVFGWFGMPPLVSFERMTEFFSVNFFRNHLMDMFVPSYTPDEAEIAQEWAELLEEHYDSFYELQLMHLFNPDYEQIQEALALSEERSIDQLAEFSTTSIFTTNAEDFIQMYFVEWEEQDAIRSMNVGDIISVEVSGGFALVYATALNPPDWDELAEMFREDFIMVRRIGLFNEIVEEWVEDADIRLNNRALNAF